VASCQPYAQGWQSRTPVNPAGRAANRAGQPSVRTRTRQDQPTVRIEAGADASLALAAAAIPESQRAGMEKLQRGVCSYLPGTERCCAHGRDFTSSCSRVVLNIPPHFHHTQSSVCHVQAGNYASFKKHAFAAKGHHVRMGYHWSQQLDKTLKDCIRSRVISEVRTNQPFEGHVALAAKLHEHGMAD